MSLMNTKWAALLTLAAAIGAALGDGYENATSTASPTPTTASVTGGPPAPARSMHRLVSSVVDDVASPSVDRNSSDGEPFLPSFRAASSDRVASTTRRPVGVDRFTPSYFLGEVIPEPYVPERFHNSRVDRNASKPASSQSRVVRPGQTKRGGFFPSAAAYVAPVREESAEDGDATTAKYGDVSHRYHSTRPVTLDDVPTGPQHDELPRHPQHDTPDHPYPFDVGGSQEWIGPPHGDSYDPAPPPPPFHYHHHHNGAPHYKLYHQHDSDMVHPPHPGAANPLKGLLRAAAALLPVGLIVASLFPNVLHVNATAAMAMPTKQQRSLDGGDGADGPPLPDCERRTLCELLRALNSTDVHRRRPDDAEVAEAAEAGACHTFACQESRPTSHDQT